MTERRGGQRLHGDKHTGMRALISAVQQEQMDSKRRMRDRRKRGRQLRADSDSLEVSGDANNEAPREELRRRRSSWLLGTCLV